MRRRLTAALALLALAGCGGLIPQREAIDSWRGEPLDAVIAQWGYPTREQAIAGRQLYIWQVGTEAPSGFHPTIVIAKDASGAGNVTPPVSDFCQPILQVDARSLVVLGD